MSTAAITPLDRPAAFTGLAQPLRGGEDSFVESMLANNPELIERYHLAMQLLETIDPSLARSFARRIRAGLEIPAAGARRSIDIQIKVETQSASARLDGDRIEASVAVERVSIRVTFASGAAAEQQPKQQPLPHADPIVLDLDGRGLRMTTVAGGRLFDINGDGKPKRTAFVAPGTALLALDRNRNGRIDSGLELFGDQYGAANGFEELRRLDQNGDGVIDARDPAYADLVILTSVSDDRSALEISPLAASGVAAIGLAYAPTEQSVNPDADLTAAGSFYRADGSSGLAADVSLAYSPLPAPPLSR